MTPRSLQVGLAKWLRVTSANVVTGRAVALTIDSARTALPCGPDEAVVSAASYALGVPKACRLAAAEAPDPMDAVRKEKRKALVKKARQAMRARRRGERGPDLKPRKRPGKSDAHCDAISHAMTIKWAKRRRGAA